MSKYHSVDGTVNFHSDKIQDTAFFFKFFSGIDCADAVLEGLFDSGKDVFNGTDSNADKTIGNFIGEDRNCFFYDLFLAGGQFLFGMSGQQHTGTFITEYHLWLRDGCV